MKRPAPVDPLEALSESELQALLDSLPGMPVAEQQQLLEDVDRLAKNRELQRCRDDFLAFCHRVYPGAVFDDNGTLITSAFKEGPHHRHMAKVYHEVCLGDQKRVTVSMPPRFGKSEFTSYLFVAWYFGHHPDHQVMMVTHTEDLSSSFGRKVRDLIDSPAYAEIFPDTVISKDKKASGSWTTTGRGVYLALGVGGAAAGKGADLLLCDDLVSEQAVLADPETAFENAWTYMQVGPLQRLMPGGRILMIATRWGKMDPIGRALKWAKDNEGSIPWHEIRFPAIINGKSLWPQQWSFEELMAKKANMRLAYWNAQYMQEPTSDEAAILKRSYWKRWTKPVPPVITFTIQTWDTAHEKKTRNDHSACITGGVFFNEQTGRDNIILLNAVKKRVEYPDLKRMVKIQAREWKPDSLIIEKKAAGAPLIQELKRVLMIEEYNPSRKGRGVANDKIARANAVSPILEEGLVWAPETSWAEEVIEDCNDFPNGDSDDLVDCLVMLLDRFRRSGFLRLADDDEDNEDEDEAEPSYDYY